MTRNYMATWRLNRMLANDPCECGNIPRVGYDKGCARCEELDRKRYRDEPMIDIVRRQMRRFDLVSLAELMEPCGGTERQMQHAMRQLVDGGEVEVVGASNATEYRLRSAS